MTADILSPPPARGRAAGIGLISGTSMDAIDAAVAEFVWDGRRYSVLAAAYVEAPWDTATRDRLRALAAGSPAAAAEIAVLHRAAGREFAAAARLAASRWTGPAPSFVCSHGQTVAHLGPRGTLQLGCGAEIAAATGLPTVADLRAADLAQGGEGAPILPAADILLRRHPDSPRILLNLGGIANATLLPPLSAGDAAGGLLAFDIGPANAILDVLAAGAGCGSGCDLDGALAASGTVDLAARDALRAALAAATAAAGSLHRETFTGALLDDWLAGPAAGSGGADRLASACAATAGHIAAALEAAYSDWQGSAGGKIRPDAVYLAGGGAHNPVLRRDLGRALAAGAGSLAGVEVRLLDDLSADGPAVVTVDNREAVDIALLGLMFLHGRAAGLPAVTGAAAPAVLGALHLPPIRPEGKEGHR